MKTTLLAILLTAPLVFAADNPKKSRGMDSDMQRAIAFERYKDLASARQARKEARHPSVTYERADRSSDRENNANRVKDPGPKK